MLEDVIAQLKQIIAHQLDVNMKVEEMAEDVSLFEEGMGLDSIMIVELITLIEHHFGFQFSDEDLNMGPFKNLRTLAAFISTKLGQSLS
jgi:acyl carrier protein